MVSVGHTVPQIDVVNSLSVTSAKATNFGSNAVNVRITRKLDTGDEQDYAIPLDTEVEMMWAVHSDSDTILAKHT